MIEKNTRPSTFRILNVSHLSMGLAIRSLGRILQDTSRASAVIQFIERAEGGIHITTDRGIYHSCLAIGEDDFSPVAGKPVVVEITNNSILPDGTVLHDAAALYEQWEGQLKVGSFEPDFGRSVEEEKWDKTISLNNSKGSGVVAIAYFDHLVSPVEQALRTLSDRAMENKVEIGSHLKAIQELLGKPAAPPKEEKPAWKSAANTFDIVAFKRNGYITNLMRVMDVRYNLERKEYVYDCRAYNPRTDEYAPLEQETYSFRESELYAVMDSSQLKACRELFDQLGPFVIDRRVPEASITDDTMGVHANGNFPPEGFFTVRVPFLFTQIMKE